MVFCLFCQIICCLCYGFVVKPLVTSPESRRIGSKGHPSRGEKTESSLDFKEKEAPLNFDEFEKVIRRVIIHMMLIIYLFLK